MEKTKFSKHAINDRMDRLMLIATTFGWGEEVISVQEDGKTLIVTDTGIMIIKSLDRKTLVTAYPANLLKVSALYHTYYGTDIPCWLVRIILRNTHKLKGIKI